VLVDCITLWLTNIFVECGASFGGGKSSSSSSSGDGDLEVVVPSSPAPSSSVGDVALATIKAEFDKLIAPWDATYVFVTNELGSGLHGADRSTRDFVDAHGWFNQHVAKCADSVIHMVAGMPNYVKRPPSLCVGGVGGGGGGREGSAASFDGGIDRANIIAAMLDKSLSARRLDMDDGGYFVMKVDATRGVIRATYHRCTKNEHGDVCDVHGLKIGCHDADDGGKGNGLEPTIIFEGRTAKELTVRIFEEWNMAKHLVTVGHAAYIGREAQRAESCMHAGRLYQQD
jgi:adenosyl cobinamide kinase/adenosyl cobinamide phosphate guanylyltransferase